MLATRHRSLRSTGVRSLSLAVVLASAAPALAQSDAYDLLWHRYLPDPIYTTTGLSEPGKMVLAGNYLNPPKEAEAIPILGDGTPDWVSPGNEFYVDASRHASVLAGLDATSADSSVVAMEWGTSSATQLWTYRIRPCRPLDANGWSSGKGVQVSDDGSTIAVVVNMYVAKALQARLCVFGQGSGVPVMEFDLPGASAASAVAITPDGAFIAVYAWPKIYVYDRYAETLRWSGSCGAGNDALAISGDGSYISWGWDTVYLRQWNGSTYQQVWTRTKTGYYASECALSTDGSTLSIGWYEYPAFTHTIIETFELPSISLLWSYDYANSGAAGDPDPGLCATGLSPDGVDAPALRDRITDVPSEMVWSSDNQLLAIASWGGNFPEIHVFGRGAATPLVIMETPGTMFDIDIVPAEDGDYWVSACGKHVHAGTSGRGGDLYALAVHTWAGVGGEPDEAGVPSSAAGFVSSWPNPTSGSTTIAFGLAERGRARLAVYDTRGRLIRVLADGVTGGSEVCWDGRDASGAAVASGVYVLQAEAGGAVVREKLVVLR